MPRVTLLAVAGFASGFAFMLGAESPEACTCRAYEWWRVRLVSDSSEPTATAFAEAVGEDAPSWDQSWDQLGYLDYYGDRYYTLRYKRLELRMERR
jgi:hypothetical protein